MSDVDFKHGRGGYTNHGCRCGVCRVGMAAYQRIWREDNMKVVRAKDRVRNVVRSEEMKKYLRAYYQDHKDECRKRNRKWDRNNRVKTNLAKSAYDRIRRRNDPSYRFGKNLRTRVGHALRRGDKCAHTAELLGCTVEELKACLELKFQPGMTWDNYGMWHVDHIRPCADFDLTVPEQQKVCFHWTNLQPLWGRDNMRKNRYCGEALFGGHPEGDADVRGRGMNMSRIARIAERIVSFTDRLSRQGQSPST